MIQKPWILAIAALFSAITLFGNSCAPYKKGSADFISASSSALPDEQSGVQMLAIVNFSNVLKSFDAMVASTSPTNYKCSVRAQISGGTGAYTTEVGSLSLDGAVTSYNAPMQMSILKIAAEYCACAADPTSASTLFAGINLGGAASQYTQSSIDSLGSKMASVFWAGIWDAAYSAELYSLVDQIRLPANSTGQLAATVTRNAALGACTSMMSSFFAIEM
jgi:hypothetical protein